MFFLFRSFGYFFGPLKSIYVTSLQQANINFSFWRPKKKKVRRRRPMRWTCPRHTPALKKRKKKFKKILKFLTQYKYSKHLNSGHTKYGSVWNFACKSDNILERFYVLGQNKMVAIFPGFKSSFY